MCSVFSIILHNCCVFFLPTQVLFELCPKDTKAAAITSGDNPHLMIINVSPLEYGHSLLVPSVNSCLPQVGVRDDATL